MLEESNIIINKNDSLRSFTVWLGSEDRFFFLELDPKEKLYLSHYKETAKRYEVQIETYTAILSYHGKLSKVICFEKKSLFSGKTRRLKTSEEELNEFRELLRLKKLGCSFQEIQAQMNYKNRTTGWAKIQYLIKHREEMAAYLDLSALD